MKKATKKYLVDNFRSPRRDLSFDKLVSSTLPFFEEVNSPVALGAYLRLKYSPSEYLMMEIRAENYLTADAFLLDYQVVKLFSKAEFFPSTSCTKKEAELSFIQAEVKCRQTNAFLANERSPFIGRPVESSILFAAQRKISQYLGKAPSLSELDYTFGPGSNVGLSKYTSIFDKLDAPVTLTSNLVSIAPQVLAEMPSWVASKAGIRAIPTPPLNRVKIPVRVVRGSKLSFVPKNAKTDRAICVEPLLNSIVQLGIGRKVRKRLRKVGCDLNDQTHNQQLARLGSLTNQLATIDLSSASDTISYNLVSRLIPTPWFELMDAARCPAFTYEGKTFQLEKFSSMGNGYTFELESLIFLALARSTCSHLGLSCENVSVYGDDIIIPTSAVQTFQKVLTFCGFVINESKSFTEGPFRESCGADWFLGNPVRPLFLKNKPSNESLFAWCNHIYRLSEGLSDPRFKVLYDCLYDLIPRSYRVLKGPAGYGDGHLHSTPVPGLNTDHSYLRRGWDGKGYFTLNIRSIIRTRNSQPVYPAALYGVAKVAGDNDRQLAKLLEPREFSDNIREPHTFSYGSKSSKDGFGIFNVRGHDCTVLVRAFHPWNMY